MNNYHAILKHPWTDVSGVVEHWASRAKSLFATEHPAEGKTKVVHVHILILDSEVQKNELRKKAQRIFPALSTDSRILKTYKDLSGNEHSCDRKGIIYLMKGEVHRVRYNKNFSPAEVEAAVRAGFNPNKPSNKTAKSQKKSERRELYEEMLKELKEKGAYSSQQVFSQIISTLRKYYKGCSESSIMSYYGMLMEDFDNLKVSYVSKLVERVTPKF